MLAPSGGKGKRTNTVFSGRACVVAALRSHPVRHALGAQVPSDLLGHGRLLRHHEHLQGRHGATGSRTMIRGPEKATQA